MTVRNGYVVFDGPVHESLPLENSCGSAVIEHMGGKLLVQAENDQLMVGWMPTDNMTPTANVSTVFLRDGERFRPEVLIRVDGPVSVCSTK